MKSQEIIFKREELYKQVWIAPVVHLAKEYGLSDVGLRKICKKMNIPLPNSGYWVRKQMGKAVDVPPLPALGEYLESYRFFKKEKQKKPEIPLSTEVVKLIELEKHSDKKITVSEPTKRLHPLVSKALRTLKADKYLDRGLASTNWKELEIRVSPNSFERATKVMDTLVRALISRRLKIITKDRGGERPTVFVLGENIRFRLTEKVNRRKRTETELERLRKKADYDWQVKEYEHTPTGRLVLTIADDTYRAFYRQYRDSKTKEVEDQLNEFIACLYEFSDVLKHRQIEKENYEKKMAEQEKKNQEESLKRWEEEREIEKILKWVESWEKSKSIRAFTDYYKEIVIKDNGEIKAGSELEKKLNFMYEIADRFDPFVSD